MAAGTFRARLFRRTSDQVAVSVQIPQPGPKNWAPAVRSPMRWARNQAVVGAANGPGSPTTVKWSAPAHLAVEGRNVVGGVVEGLDQGGEDDAVPLTGQQQRGYAHRVDVRQRTGLDRQDGVDTGVRADDDGGRAALGVPRCADVLQVDAVEEDAVRVGVPAGEHVDARPHGDPELDMGVFAAATTKP